MQTSFFYSSGQRVLEEFEEHLVKEEDRRDEIQNDLDKASHTLANVRSGVEHLTKKLHNIKPVSNKLINNNTDKSYILRKLCVFDERLY